MLDIQENVPLAKWTTFRIGGPARFFVSVRSEEELIEALDYAEKEGLAVFVMGGGSNVLFSDQGFAGLVIKVTIGECKVGDLEIECGAGVPLAKLVRESAENGFAGMEWAAGIPGTVGGAVRGNAGAFGKTVGESVGDVRAYRIDEKKIITVGAAECGFGYRDSIFKQGKNLIVLSAKFKFQLGKREELQGKIKEIIEKRIALQPHGMGSAGSFFMNPVVGNEELIARFENEKKTAARGNKLPAGWIIQEAGLKGKRIGGASVSETHGDFLLNAGNATAEDVIMLESFIKQQVRDQFGVQLQSEVEHVGF